MDTKLQRKELSKLWIQRKGDNSNVRSDYVHNSVTGMYKYFCL